jgi:glycosyltransferase involved in cell wall biosynthesis
MYRVLVTCFNAKLTIEKCLISIQSQTFTDWQCYVLNDMSEDDSLEIATSCFGDDERFVFINNGAKKYQLGNYASCILGFDDDDVCITVDADDWLSDAKVFDRIHNAYERGAWMTWGSYETFLPSGEIAKGMGGGYIANLELLRQQEWVPSHLRTWKVFLWRKIDDMDLRDGTGEYFTVAGDMAFMYPMVEMARDNGQYLQDINYFYNNRSELCNHLLRRESQDRNNRIIRSKPSYFRNVLI